MHFEGVIHILGLTALVVLGLPDCFKENVALPGPSSNMPLDQKIDDLASAEVCQFHCQKSDSCTAWQYLYHKTSHGGLHKRTTFGSSCRLTTTTMDTAVPVSGEGELGVLAGPKYCAGNNKKNSHR